ncbi:MAG: hypothetical protein KGD63_03880 [Candidatus Lokiarchaeota archaeon]|nr:hypothetical protein [Candidatus Lokiarchaeota archaeon]
MEELKEQLLIKEKVILTLQDSLKLKDEQINTVKESLRLKDEQMRNLESSIDIKDQKVEIMQKSIEIKEKQMVAIENSLIDKSILQEKEKKIKELEKQLELLNDELSKSDDEFEKLETEIENIKNSSLESIDKKIMDFTYIDIARDDILNKMKDILGSSNHNVMIVAPSILDLQYLHLYDVRSSVSLKISTLINPGIDEHTQLLEEFESLDNISIRLYEGQDRFIILKDGEELLFAVIGEKTNNFLAFHTQDANHISLFNALVMETWLRSKKI